MTRTGGYSKAELRLVEEWADVLGRIAIVSRQSPTPFFRALRAKDLDLMKGWIEPGDEPSTPALESLLESDGHADQRSPVDCVRACLHQIFRFEWGFGDFSNHAGKGETAKYILVYLCPRLGLAANLLQIFVPILRPGLWDDQFRWRLEHMFFEHAWAAVFDYDHLVEPEVGVDFDWPDALNDFSVRQRREMLEYAGIAAIPDPERPEIAPWNTRWFELGLLWSETSA